MRRPLSPFPFLLFIYLAFFAMVQAMSVVIVSEAYLGHPVTPLEAVRRVIPRFWPAVWVEFLKGVLIVAGFICFIIPGFLCSLWFFGAMNVLVIENVGAKEALRRSRQIARGSLGRIFSIRKEELDLDVMAEQLDAGTVLAPAPSVGPAQVRALQGP